MQLLLRTVGNAGGLWLAVTLLPGMSVPGHPGFGHLAINLLVVGLILALVNAIIKPTATLLTLPIYLLTLGLFALVVNGAMLLLASRLTRALVDAGVDLGVPIGLHVGGFGTAVLGSIIVTIVSAITVAALRREPRD